MDKLNCEFLHCDATETLIVVVMHDDKPWGLCPLHEKIVSKNGASVEYEGGKDYLFSPIMLKGKPD